MTLTIFGSITMEQITCEKCGAIIRLYNCPTKIKCTNCAATYQVSKQDLGIRISESGEQRIELIYNFVEFQCIYAVMSGDCTNHCPALGMYCKEHASDSFLKDAESNISYCEERVIVAKEKLQRIEESKKIWLIEELSGINEDDIISKNAIK